MMRRWLRRIPQTLLAFAVVGGVVYWMKFAPFPVKTHRLEPGLIVAEVMGTGTLEARTKTTVSPKIAGRIAQVLVDQNQRVETGNLLIHLDDDELKQQVAIAEANVTAEQAAIERLKADQERAAAVASQAKKQHARVQSLVEQRAVSQEDLDRAIESLSIAVAGLAHAEAAIAERSGSWLLPSKRSSTTAPALPIPRLSLRSRGLSYAGIAIRATWLCREVQCSR